MALSGDLKDFGLIQLLTLVQVTGKTGSLTLERQSERGTIYFQNGMLTRVKAPNSHSASLATALYQAGRIDRDQYQMVESGVAPSEKAVALTLSDQGMLSREEIVEFVRERSVSDLYWLMTWPDGNFQMDIGVAPPDEEIAAPTDLSPVLEKGKSYLNEWQLLTSYIPDLERPLRLLSRPKQPVEEVTLELDEWQLVVSLAKAAPLKEVASRLGLDNFKVRQVAYQLISAGLADIPEPEPVPQPRYEEAQQLEERSGGFRLFGRRK